MIVDWRGDNAGPPPKASDVIDDFEAIQRLFPGVCVPRVHCLPYLTQSIQSGARIKASTFDEFAAELETVPEDRLPIITSEMGDTWVHGVASDPTKVAFTRAAQRHHSECVHSPSCDSSSYAFHNFSRLLMKNSG